ncbi:MAG: polyphenol oxidase family protein [Ktedonobacterales bacterium]
MIERHTDHCEYLQFEQLAAIPGLVHAVFTRRRGFSRAPFAGLNASSVTGDDPAAVQQNKAAIISALSLPLVAAKPVHGAEVALVRHSTSAERSGDWLEVFRERLRRTEADAMLADQPGFALCWAYGDCAPVLLYDPEHLAFALVHAGWRGTAAGVVPQAVQAMERYFGSRPEAVLAGVGPAIGACCYEVDEKVREAFAGHPLAWDCAEFVEREPGSKHATGLFLDIAGSNYRQLLAMGIKPEHVDNSGYCTGCRTDLFYSHRCEPWPSGRFAVAIGLQS